MKESEDFMYKNYRNYQKYFPRVFSVLRNLTHDKETQKWMIEMRKELDSMLKDYIEYEIITTEEEKGCFLFGMMEIMVGS